MEKWIKSSYCAADKPQCVEVSISPGSDWVRVRDSKDTSSDLLFTRGEWDAFVAGVKAGEFG